jgi:glycerol-1-phosphate dehydrogenase [NAD(P)+]
VSGHTVASPLNAVIPVYCGEEAIARLIQHCQSRRLSRFLLVGDQNTYAVLGRRVEMALKERGWDVRTVVLHGPEVRADERRVFEVLFHADGEALTYVAVGSGTVTDIIRYASYCARNAFISLPTAPSVDGYASRGAALVMGGFKLTVPSHAPAAIFADLRTLCEAPRDMTAAGFGDMLGKYTALADWRLAALLLDEPYSVDIARRARRALLDCVEHAEEIGRASATGVARLMAGLLESGRCMAEFGSSRPASGAEHLLSHFWEMKRMQGRRPSMLHGAKVGVGTVLTAQRYERIRSLVWEGVAARLSVASPPDREDEIARIRTAYGPAADRVIADHRPFLEVMEASFGVLRRRIGDRWGEIQEIAASVPPAREVAGLLAQVGGPHDPQAIGLGEDEVQQALRLSRYLRRRFTVGTLGRVLGLW